MSQTAFLCIGCLFAEVLSFHSHVGMEMHIYQPGTIAIAIRNTYLYLRGYCNDIMAWQASVRREKL